MRKYYLNQFEPDSWENVKNELEKLLNYNIDNKNDFEIFLEMVSEINFIISEYMAWKYIKMTCNADNPEYSDEFNRYYAEVVSKSEPYSFKIDKKIYESVFFNDLDEKFEVMKKIVKKDIEMFREENVELSVKENELTTKYSELSSKLTVEFEGKEQTLVQMKKYQKESDREIRKSAWIKTYEKLYLEKDNFNEIFDKLKELRVKMAENADYSNYRDYMHNKKGRFDYTVEDIKAFHNSVEKVVVPFLKELNQKKKENLKLDKLRPWDTEVDTDGKILKPFETAEDLINKMITILSKIDNNYGKKLSEMKEKGFLDLDNRKGKAPGGYNYPLEETGAAFIFMNSIGLHSDMVTLAHEAGHAMHSFATAEKKYIWDRNYPSEVAELASMSMELMTMDYWEEYYNDKSDLKKAKIEQLEDSLKILPWVMIVDGFQHWIYTNPNHTVEERYEYFEKLMNNYNTGVDWTGYEDYKKIAWFRQLHIFEVPFYYIEYAMSQLGALAIYKNYKENKERAIESYNNFLNKGYSIPVKKLYEEAGIKFDFSEKYIEELVKFVKKELEVFNGRE